MSMSQEHSNGRGDDDLIPVSGLNDFLYCPRRAWLHRVEGVFEHSADTLEGSYQHEIVDQSTTEARPGVRVVRALPLFAPRLGLVGKADVIEFCSVAGADSAETPYPVDYKHGPRRRWDNDDVQLCAQGLCLEEMFGQPVPAGAIFHIRSKRRREVFLDAALRERTLRAVAGMRSLLALGHIPPPVMRPQCQGCSLQRQCIPEVANDSPRVSAFVRSLFRCEAPPTT